MKTLGHVYGGIYHGKA